MPTPADPAGPPTRPRTTRPRDERGTAAVDKVLAVLATVLIGTGVTTTMTPLGSQVSGGLSGIVCSVVALFGGPACTGGTQVATTPPFVPDDRGTLVAGDLGALSGLGIDDGARLAANPTAPRRGVILPPGGRRKAGCYTTTVDQPVTLRQLLVPGTYEAAERALKQAEKDTEDEILRKEIGLAALEQELRGDLGPVRRQAVRFQAWQHRNVLAELKEGRRILGAIPLRDLSVVVGRHTVNLRWRTDGTKVTEVPLVDARFDYGNQPWITWKKRDDPLRTPPTALPATTNQVTSTADLDADLKIPLVPQFGDAASKIPFVGETIKSLLNSSLPLRHKSRVTVADNVRYTEFSPGPSTDHPAKGRVDPRHC